MAIGEVWASDLRQVGITLQPPIEREAFNTFMQRLNNEMVRQGGDYATQNAAVVISIRDGLLDIVAEWQGFISPHAEKCGPNWPEGGGWAPHHPESAG